MRPGGGLPPTSKVDRSGPGCRIRGGAGRGHAGDASLYERYLDRMRAVATSDAQEEQRFRDGLTAFEDPGLVSRTIEACFNGTIRTQDMGLMLVGLLGSRHSRRIAWPVVRDRWDSDIAPLEALLKSRVIGGVGQLTPAGISHRRRSSSCVPRRARTRTR